MSGPAGPPDGDPVASAILNAPLDTTTDPEHRRAQVDAARERAAASPARVSNEEVGEHIAAMAGSTEESEDE
jgi:hypothetical protein